MPESFWKPQFFLHRNFAPTFCSSRPCGLHRTYSLGILGSDDCCAVTCKGISVTCKGILGDVVSCICAGNIQKSLILNDLKHDLIPAPRETTPVVRILTQGSQIGKLFQSIYQINPIVILTRGSQIGKLFRSIYQIDPIAILTHGFPNWKIISTNLSNKSNCNSHSGIPNWKIISTNLSNKSNSNYFVQIRKVIKIASRHHEST